MHINAGSLLSPDEFYLHRRNTVALRDKDVAFGQQSVALRRDTFKLQTQRSFLEPGIVTDVAEVLLPL